MRTNRRRFVPSMDQLQARVVLSDLGSVDIPLPGPPTSGLGTVDIPMPGPEGSGGGVQETTGDFPPINPDLPVVV